MSNLENKNIIVTGASGGIGNAIIKKLSDAGANILASGTKIEKLEELKKKFEKTSLLKEKIFSLVSAIPKDIKIRNIVAYINKKVVFSTNPGSSKS